MRVQTCMYLEDVISFFSYGFLNALEDDSFLTETFIMDPYSLQNFNF